MLRSEYRTVKGDGESGMAIRGCDESERCEPEIYHVRKRIAVDEKVQSYNNKVYIYACLRATKMVSVVQKQCGYFSSPERACAKFKKHAWQNLSCQLNIVVSSNP